MFRESSHCLLCPLEDNLLGHKAHVEESNSQRGQDFWKELAHTLVGLARPTSAGQASDWSCRQGLMMPHLSQGTQQAAASSVCGEGVQLKAFT